MQIIRKDLLLKLADMLEADAGNPTGAFFSLDVLVDNPDIEEIDSSDFKPDRPIPLTCNTKVCAFELAMLSGQFKGLTYDIHYPEQYADKMYNGEIRPVWEETIMSYDYAASHMFGINLIQAHYLFSPSYYSRKIEGAEGERFVAARIRKFVADDGQITDPYES